jgi:DNA invertase Pin-like site-specific DNA recombinase
MTDAGLVQRRSGSSCDKIVRRHQDRLAIVYVRQSTAQRVERHQESTKLQYALADRAAQFGWLREQIVVIDDDLGRSGASVEGRLGFQRLVAEVGLGKVGLVLGVEMSRLARSCRDWHQLLEICALFDTLIADADGVYDPANYNDRLLLGLKGTMSEAELYILKARMLAGRKAKARRGELGKPVPIGYMRRPSGEIVFDPDEQRRRRSAWSSIVRPLQDGRQGDDLPDRARHPHAGAPARRRGQRRAGMAARQSPYLVRGVSPTVSAISLPSDRSRSSAVVISPRALPADLRRAGSAVPWAVRNAPRPTPLSARRRRLPATGSSRSSRCRVSLRPRRRS